MPRSDTTNTTSFQHAEPMRIGLIADTHIPRDTRMLPPHVQEALKDTDLILHAGDIYLPKVLDDLETLAPVLAARGNGDWEFPRDHRLNDNHILNINGFNLLLIHSIDYLGPPGHPLDEVMERKFGKRIDIIVSGDTHVAMVTRHKDILLVNPGSPTLPNGLLELGTVGLLEIIESRVEARIVPLSDFPLPFDRKLIYHTGDGA